LKATIVVLGGDGIGPEVTAEAVRVLQTIAEEFGHELTFTERMIGGCSIDTVGTPITGEVLAVCKSADAVLLGAVGGPKWDDPNAPTRPEDGLLALRKGLALYANLRPVKPHPALIDASPIKTEKLQGVDLIVVRELAGGLYFGQPKCRQRINDHIRAVDTLEYHDYEIERILKLAFELSRHRRKKLTSIDKANVLETSRLWRQTANALAPEYPDIALEHMLVDTASMRLVSSPLHFDVLVTENMFGDILTDEASVLAGSMGLLPSASLGDGGPGLFEPIHGSAPDIAGKGIANPVGSILSAAMLLRHSLHLDREAATVESAVEMALAEGCRTLDLGGKLSTQQMANAVTERLSTH